MTIPGVTLRPFDPERDYPGITRVIAAQQLADRVQYVPTEASLRNDYENSAGLVPARDVIVAEADGMIVATAAVARGIREGEIDFNVDCAVDPTWRLRGIGAVLLRWQESRARDRLVEQAAVSKRLHEPGEALGLVPALGDPLRQTDHRVARLAQIDLQLRVEMMGAGQVGIDRQRTPDRGFREFEVDGRPGFELLQKPAAPSQPRPSKISRR